MAATHDQAEFVFIEWHERIRRRDATALSALYTDDAVLESPLVCRVLDRPIGVVSGRDDLDRFLAEIVRRRPSEDDLPALYRTGTYLFDGHTLVWEYPRLNGDGVDQLDLVEVMDLAGPLIRHHRIYWGWRGTEHVIANAVDKASVGRRPGADLLHGMQDPRVRLGAD